MKVEGEGAARLRAVRLDSLEDANKGELVSADEDTGVVAYKDVTGAVVTLTFGPRAIKLVRR